jgi:uncharacterized iron-regulated membrane protein
MTTATFFRWHLWLGVATGVFMFIVGGSGAVAVFIEELDWLVTPALRADVPAGSPRAGADALVAAVRAAHPDGRLTALNLSVRPSFAHVAKVTSPARGNLDVFLDPAAGRVQGEREYSAAYTSTLRNFIRQLHLRLFMGLWGRVFVGFFGVTLVLSCVTGLWIYRGWFKNLLRLRWRAPGWRTRWSDLHKIVGLWSLLLNLVFGLTGAVYGYENLAGQIRSHWLRPARAEPAAPRPAAPRAAAAGEPLPLDALLARAREAFPALTVRNILLPANATAPVVLRGDVPSWSVQQSHVRRVNFISLDARSGAVLRQFDGRDATGWDRLYSSFDPLHFGYFGGTPTKIAWFVLGLAPSALAFTGAWLWWRRTQGRRRAPPPAADPAIARIATAAALLALAAAYVLVARAHGTWALTGRLVEHALAKPLALALTAFPITGLLVWLAWRSTAQRGRFAAVCLACAAWYAGLATLFQ